MPWEPLEMAFCSSHARKANEYAYLQMHVL